MVPSGSTNEMIVASGDPLCARPVLNLIPAKAIVARSAVELVISAEELVVAVERNAGCRRQVVADDEVTVGPPEKDVVAALDDVVSRAVPERITEERVSTTAAVEEVISAGDAIGARRRRSRVDGVALQDVDAVLSIQDVIPRNLEARNEITNQVVVAVASPDCVVAESSAEDVISTKAEDDVVASKRLNGVRAWCSHNHVVPFSAEDIDHRHHAIHPSRGSCEDGLVRHDMNRRGSKERGCGNADKAS